MLITGDNDWLPVQISGVTFLWDSCCCCGEIQMPWPLLRPLVWEGSPSLCMIQELSLRALWDQLSWFVLLAPLTSVLASVDSPGKQLCP